MNLELEGLKNEYSGNIRQFQLMSCSVYPQPVSLSAQRLHSAECKAAKDQEIDVLRTENRQSATRVEELGGELEKQLSEKVLNLYCQIVFMPSAPRPSTFFLRSRFPDLWFGHDIEFKILTGETG